MIFNIFSRGGGSKITPGTSSPIMDNAASAGNAETYSRSDHVHPKDTSLAPIASPTLSGSPKAVTKALTDIGDNIATTAWVEQRITQYLSDDANNSSGVVSSNGNTLTIYAYGNHYLNNIPGVAFTVTDDNGVYKKFKMTSDGDYTYCTSGGVKYVRTSISSEPTLYLRKVPSERLKI